MRDSLSLGSTPCGEDCAQVGDDNYGPLSKVECRAYIERIKAEFGDPPAGCYLRTVSQPHDFGAYLEVFAIFDDKDQAGIDWAYNIEEHLPETWEYGGFSYKPAPAADGYIYRRADGTFATFPK